MRFVVNSIVYGGLPSFLRVLVGMLTVLIDAKKFGVITAFRGRFATVDIVDF
jgi:hypothetical protein